MLNGTLQLHDPRCTQNGHGCHHGCITNTERFCAALLERRQIKVGSSEYEDTLAYLISQAWEHTIRYRPELDTGHRSNLAAYIQLRLSRSFTDQRRSKYRTIWKFKDSRPDYHYQRPTPIFVQHTELERTQRDGTMEAADAGSTDLLRLLRGRGGTDPRSTHSMGEDGTQAAA
jgi:hypothetical protein